MAARRCSVDSINYPAGSEFKQCLVCGEDTAYFYNAVPDADWQERVAELQELAEQMPAPLDDLVPRVECGIVTRSGELFISAWDVYDVVKSRLKPGDLIRVGEQTFEILEYVHASREYWIRPFATELTEEDLRRLADGGR